MGLEINDIEVGLEPRGDNVHDDLELDAQPLNQARIYGRNIESIDRQNCPICLEELNN